MKVNFKNKKFIMGLIGIVLFILIGFVIKCPSALQAAAEAKETSPHQAMMTLALLVWAICWWSVEVIPTWLTGMIMMLCWPLFGIVNFEVAFGQWGKSTIWLIWGAFAIAAAAGKTGLLKRLAYSLMKIFPASFGGMTASMLVIGTVVAPLIPSANAKTMLGVSIADSIADNMGLEAESKGRYGLFNAAWFGFGLTIPVFLTASAIGPMLKAYLSEETAARLTFTGWFVAMIPWLVIFLALSWLAINVFYGPKQKTKLSKEFINDALKGMGKMGRDEAITAILLVVVLILWIFESKIGLAAGLASAAVGACLFLFHVLDFKKMDSMPWSTLMWVVLTLTLGSVLSAMGINGWLQGVFAPVFSGLSNPFILIILITVFCSLARFILPSQAVALTTFIAIMSPVLEGLGYNPFPFFIVIYCAVQCWWMPYVHATYAPLPTIMNGVTKDPRVKNNFIYYAVSLIGLFASVPFWKLIGWM